jgi:hypothetical protein
MQEKAKVIAVDGDIVTVIPLEIEACINCANTECKKNGNVFRAVNRRGLKLKPGSEVRIAASLGKQTSQGLVAVGLPLSLAVFGYFFVQRLFPGSGEGLRVGVALLAFLVGAVGVFACTRGAANKLPEVVEEL